MEQQKINSKKKKHKKERPNFKKDQNIIRILANFWWVEFLKYS
jgi:hypothetical protein